MRVSELKREMDEQFARVDERFARVDERFAQVDARFDRVDARFLELEARIKTEGATTRRHIEVLTEQSRAESKLILDAVVAMDERLGRFMASNMREHAHFDSVL